ncbi:hypothetical protein GALL_56260 [mine drainage metagenome]|uniref:YCII-related domain protein n=1 Tax=mine drainage metagenome TaxID=410659 RepID=A0A1J5SXH6_9ZZZZ
MKEFKLIIRNQKDNFSKLNSEDQTQFLKKCEVYINQLKSEEKLLGAQPLVREGKIISYENGIWIESEYDAAGSEVIVGYYHILANDLNEAIEIAKQNPEFEYSNTARIEVRPIKTKESTTGFVYPKKS